MQLKDYQWSLNPRGMHNEGAFRKLDLSRYLPIQMGWMKLVVGGEEFMDDCRWFLSVNITPIIRVYRETMGAMAPDEPMRLYWRQYASIGVKWFEFYNEPNLALEWPGGRGPDYRNIDGVIRPMCENWLTFAEYIISLGAYPAFPALAETSDAVMWLDALLGYMRDNLRDRFMHVANNGLWLASHPYTLNHFYQEVPGQPATPRQPAQVTADEGGWHFEYPYDPLTQSLDPGRNVFTGTGDVNGLIAMGIAFTQRIQEWFGLGPLPVVGTEGGVYPLPIHDAQQYDRRYPVWVDRHVHAEATVAMFEWIALQSPEWMFGVTMWKEDEYYNNNLPAIQRLQQKRAIGKGGANIDYTQQVRGRGPGPVKGEPTDHIVILGPGLDPRWFFETAQAYWNRFRPAVTTGWQFIGFMPYERSLAATIISPPDMVDTIRQTIQEQYPNVRIDVIIAAGDLSSVADVLNGRVWSDRRLG